MTPNRFMLGKSTEYIGPDFFELQAEPDENPDQTWERLLNIEQKFNFGRELDGHKFELVITYNYLKGLLETKKKQNTEKI